MILPSKHIKNSESLLGLGGIVLQILVEPKTIDDIWFKYSSNYNNKQIFPTFHNFDNLVLALNYLYLIGSIAIDKKGNIKKCV